MSNLIYTDYPGFGDFARATRGYHQAVRIGDRIECSGQGGWVFENDSFSFPSDLAAQIEQAFRNVETALRAAGGAGWSQVYRLNSYHTDLTDEATRATGECFERFLGDRHRVIWTQVGVAQLAAEGMHVELEVCAYLG